MKIGLVTIIGNDNYGNRLQNFAIQKYLEKKNIEVETLQNEMHTNERKKYLLRKIKYINYKGTYSNVHGRRIKFEEFNKNINFSQKKITAYSYRNKYDYYIVGSDQVWNYSAGRLRDVDLLKMIPPKKRIAFSASFGTSTIPEKCTHSISNELKKFKQISVREEKGKEIIENLTNRNDVEVLIDPTMLLSIKEWDEVSKKPIQLKNKRYILNYFLGDLSNERQNEIKRVARENNCEIINILDKNSIFYESGPSEFLYLEKNAFLICTDSFHSCVFAILYNRPFIVFEREQKGIEKMNSRLDTLINKFKLKNRKFEGKITEKNLKHDYTEAYKILENERKKSEIFLKNALDIKE